jgi:hypothetical protein
MALGFPKIAAARDGASRRAARQQLVTAIAATRAAAFQKGKIATLSLTSTSATVSVLSGLAGNAVTVMGPIRFNTSLGSTITPLSGAPPTVQFNSRGMLTPTPEAPLRYLIVTGTLRDTVCVSPIGVIMPKGCVL